MNPRGRSVAVIGSGVAGLTAAYALTRSEAASVTLYEADNRLGGHADTHDVLTSAGTVGIDTGFIVHNDRTYPVLTGLFRELGVQTQASDMSMSVRCEETGLEWAGALGLSGLFPTWRNLTRASYLRLLTEIPRFHRMARTVIATPGDDERLADFLDRGGFSDTFRTHFMESLVACVWSCDPGVALDYPARYLFTFLDHHGMLQIFGSPQWRTVSGGSRSYVERVAATLDEVRIGAKVTSVHELGDGVEVTDGNGEVRRFDAVVIATHPGQALAMLAEPTSAQAELLAAMPYSANTAQLHTDASVLPRHERARASWNYLRRDPRDATGSVTVTYDLTRLMRLPSPDGVRHLVTLGGSDLIDPDAVIETMEYEHPLYTPTSVAAQQRMDECDSDRVVFAGAWRGWGFHEDGARSGLDAAIKLGARWQPTPQVDSPAAADPALPAVPALYATTVRHTRRRPFRREFTNRTHTWLVDLADLPDYGVLGRFEARDHLGDPTSTIRDNVVGFLARNGIDLAGGRILMAANARALGYCFNPISVHWCFASTGDELAAVVVEVHNTYGDRHAYLVHPDGQGRARTEKAMYVSPFHGVDGHYEMAVPVPGERFSIVVSLHTDDGAAFSASLAGPSIPPSPLRAAPAALLGSLKIRWHGIRLWARRLTIRPRPEHAPQEGVQ